MFLESTIALTSFFLEDEFLKLITTSVDLHNGNFIF